MTRSDSTLRLSQRRDGGPASVRSLRGATPESSPPRGSRCSWGPQRVKKASNRRSGRKKGDGGQGRDRAKAVRSGGGLGDELEPEPGNAALDLDVIHRLADRLGKRIGPNLERHLRQRTANEQRKLAHT